MTRKSYQRSRANGFSQNYNYPGRRSLRGLQRPTLLWQAISRRCWACSSKQRPPSHHSFARRPRLPHNRLRWHSHPRRRARRPRPVSPPGPNAAARCRTASLNRWTKLGVISPPPSVLRCECKARRPHQCLRYLFRRQPGSRPGSRIEAIHEDFHIGQHTVFGLDKHVLGVVLAGRGMARDPAKPD